MADTSINANRRMSSSAELSSPPPKSPESPPAGDSIVLLSTAAPAVKQEAAPKPKPKRVRKPKLAADGTEIAPTVRKSRAKKKEPDQNASSTTTSTASTSNSKATAASKSVAQTTAKATRPSRINELISTSADSSVAPQQQNSVTQPKSSPIGTKSEAIQNFVVPAESPKGPDAVISPPPQHQSQLRHHTNVQQQAVAVASSSSRGQNYDPIRSSTITAPRSVPITNPSTPIQVSPLKPPPRASTSPSIASLINPPSASETFLPERPSSSLSPAKPIPTQLVRSDNSTPVQSSPALVPIPLVKPPTPTVDSHDPMEIDQKPVAVSREPSISNDSARSANPDKAQEKSVIAKPRLPPLPGQGFGASSGLGTRAIVIEVPLKDERYTIINFQQLAIEKYGFDTVFPKLARQKELLRSVAANAAALERKPGATTSNDEMSIDGSDNEAELSTGSKRKAPNEVDEPIKKKRLMKEDMYDKDDPFVDDAEMAWEERAAAVKDGFFVYSGLLVPAGADAKVEKSDGTTGTKKRARTTKAATTKSATTAKTTKDKPDEKDKKEEDKKETKAAPSNAKDGADTKKPKPAAPRKRPTKAEAEARRAEKERLAKEKAAAAGIVGSPSRPTNGGTSTSTAPVAGSVTDQVPNTAASSALSSAAPTANSTPRPISAVPSMSSPA